MAGPAEYPGAPFRFADSEWPAVRAPLLGEHNHELYVDRLGISPGECDRMQLEELRQQRYTVYNTRATAGGEVLFATRTIDPVAAAAESRRSGLWVSATVTDALWPAEDGRTRPLMPLRRGHLAMLVAAGFLENLQLEADGSRILRAPCAPSASSWPWMYSLDKPSASPHHSADAASRGQRALSSAAAPPPRTRRPRARLALGHVDQAPQEAPGSMLVPVRAEHGIR